MGFARRVVVALASLTVGARAQQCDDSCDSATALCEADVVVDATYYDVCYPTASKKIDANVIGGLKSDGVAVEALADGGRITVVANYMVGCNAGRREASAFAYVAQLYANAFGGASLGAAVTEKVCADAATLGGVQFLTSTLPHMARSVPRGAFWGFR